MRAKPRREVAFAQFAAGYGEHGKYAVCIGTQGLLWLLAGGLAYTAGVVFYVLDARIRYAHAIWHGFVLAGTGCHFFAVLGYAA